MKKLIIALLLLTCLFALAQDEPKAEANPNISPGKRIFLDPKDDHSSQNFDQPPPPSSDNLAYKPIIWEGKVFLTSNVYINNGEMLIINPGTQVLAAGNYVIVIQPGAHLQAQGNIDQPIVFAPDFDYDQNPGEISAGMPLEYWQGFKFSPASNLEANAVFEHCLFSNNQPKPLDNPQKEIESSLFNIQKGNSLIFSNCLFSNNIYPNSNLLKAEGATLAFINCQFKQNYASFDISYSSLQFSNSALVDNHLLHFDISHTNTDFVSCQIINNFDFALQLSEKRSFKLDHSSISTNYSSQNALFCVTGIDSCQILNSAFTANNAALLQCLNSDLLIQRTLINSQNSPWAVSADATLGKRTARIINCSFVDNPLSYPVALGSNNVFIIINSIIKGNNVPSIRVAPASKASSFYALNSVLTPQKSLQNDLYRMTTVWNDIIDPLSTNVLPQMLIDKGYKEYISQGNVIFSFSPSQYRGIAPDIGWQEIHLP